MRSERSEVVKKSWGDPNPGSACARDHTFFKKKIIRILYSIYQYSIIHKKIIVNLLCFFTLVFLSLDIFFRFMYYGQIVKIQTLRVMGVMLFLLVLLFIDVESWPDLLRSFKKNISKKDKEYYSKILLCIISITLLLLIYVLLYLL